MRREHIVVLGGGFGGLEVGRRLAGRDVRVTVVDRQNHHLFQPLLYQVATAGLAPSEIAEPIRSIFRRADNVSVVMDEATRIDADRRRVQLNDNGAIEYDRLVIATGAETFYFGNEAYARHARGLKTLDDAEQIRDEILAAFEKAEMEDDPARRDALMRIVVIGGGPTGVELAGAVAELTRHVLARDFRNIDPSKAEIVLLEVAPRVLLPFSEKLSASAKRQLEELGVQVRLEQKIQDVREGVVTLADREIHAANILWGAGVGAGPLGETLDVERDDRGRIHTLPDLSVPGHPEIFAIGDVAHVEDGEGNEVPALAQGAIQMGRYVAQRILDEIEGAQGTREPFVYSDKGTMATLGRSRAVAQIGRFEFSGLVAWLAWLLVHLIMLIGFRNRVIVLVQWFSAYVAYRRGARIIEGRDRSFTSTKRVEREDADA
jgi:NADH dehydrogenase